MIDLKKVKDEYPDYISDSKKLKSLLSDLYPSESLYGSILCAMLDDGTVNKIKSMNTIDKLTLANIRTSIEEKHGYAQKYIDGCLAIWASVYDIKIVDIKENIEVVPIKKTKAKDIKIETTIHTHKFVEKKIAPTCDQKGYTLHKCACGYEYTDNYVNPKHDFVLVEYIEPTCENDGRELYKCTSCGEEKEKVIEAKGHNFGACIEQEKPSCEKDGFSLRQCKRCGKKEQQTIKATGHHFKQWRPEGDYFVRDCDRCGKTEKMSQSDFYFMEAEKYRKGEKVKLNLEKAYEFYLEAAKLGKINAMVQVAFFLEKGIGVEKNYYDAIKWYEKAAEKNDAIALNNLGVMYLDGLGVQVDEIIAEEYFRKALAVNSEYAIAKDNLNKALIIKKQQEKKVDQESKKKIRTVLIWVTVIVVWIGIAIGFAYSDAEFNIAAFFIALIAIPIILCVIGAFCK